MSDTSLPTAAAARSRRDVRAPIGVMDSGVGGLTVVRAMVDQLPHESIRYFGDTRHSPYGEKPLDFVRQRGLQILDDFVAVGVKALVIACNTASAAMLRDARLRYDIPVIEVIAPAVRRAASVTRTGVVGVIGTTATIGSRAYDDAFASNPGITVVSAACPRFVDFVERGVTSGSDLMTAAREYLDPLINRGIDTLVLGCTHYPLLAGVIQLVAGDNVALVSSAEETAKEVYRCLIAEELLAPDDVEAVHSFYVSAAPAEFATLARRFLAVPALDVSLAAADSSVR